MLLQNNVTTPWGRAGSTFEVDEPDEVMKIHLHEGNLSRVDYVAEEAFDPKDHTVEEVNDYLATAEANEQARVLAEEAKGKNRKSVGLPEVDEEDDGGGDEGQD